MKKMIFVLLGIVLSQMVQAQTAKHNELRNELIQAGYQPKGLTEFAMKELMYASAKLYGQTVLSPLKAQYDADVLSADPGSGISATMKTKNGLIGISDEVAIELKYAIFAFYIESADMALNKSAFYSHKAVAVRCLEIQNDLQNLPPGMIVRPIIWCGFKTTYTKF